MNDILKISIISTILLTVILFSKKIFKNTSKEGARKLIHVCTGITTLTFPFIFDSHIPVLIIGILSLIALTLLKHVKFLRKNFGKGLFGVDRKSYGEIFFGISVVILFTLYKLTNQNVVTYLIPILTLTFADSTAALIGVRYGMNKISSKGEDTKSIEGSFIFFVVTFMATLFPLQLMTNVGRAEVLLICIFTGALAAMVEMISHDGNDNLMLPLYTYIIINYNINKTLDELLLIFIIMIGLIFLSYAIYKFNKISKLAVVSALLTGYMTLILGSINWLYIPILVFLSFGVFPMATKEERKNELNYKIIDNCTVIGTIFVCIKAITGMIDICFLCFLASYCCLLAMNTFVRLHIFHKKEKYKSIFLSMLKSIIVIEIPYIIFNASNNVYRPKDWGVLIISMFISLLIESILIKKYDYSITNIKAAEMNKYSVGVISSTIFVIYYLNLIF